MSKKSMKINEKCPEDEALLDDKLSDESLDTAYDSTK